MHVAVCRKRDLFRIWKQSLNEEDRKKYSEANKDGKRVVYNGNGSENSRGSGEG